MKLFSLLILGKLVLGSNVLSASAETHEKPVEAQDEWEVEAASLRGAKAQFIETWLRQLGAANQAYLRGSYMRSDYYTPDLHTRNHTLRLFAKAVMEFHFQHKGWPQETWKKFYALERYRYWATATKDCAYKHASLLRVSDYYNQAFLLKEGQPGAYGLIGNIADHFVYDKIVSDAYNAADAYRREDAATREARNRPRYTCEESIASSEQRRKRTCKAGLLAVQAAVERIEGIMDGWWQEWSNGGFDETLAAELVLPVSLED